MSSSCLLTNTPKGCIIGCIKTGERNAVVDRKRAESLREQGFTYKQISILLECSIDWCKHNLKHIVVADKEFTKEQLERLELRDV